MNSLHQNAARHLPVRTSPLGKIVTFIPTATLSGWLTSGSGPALSEGGKPNPTKPNDSSSLSEP